MIANALFIYTDDYGKYSFHSEHPFNQKRVKMTKDLLESAGKLDQTQVAAPRKATEEELGLLHSKSYIEAVKQASNGKLSTDDGLKFGIGTEDTPMFPHMHEAASTLVGGTLTAVEAVLENKAVHAVNLGGGLHHGMYNKASGFCIYNDAAIAIKYIRKIYGMRVLYVDTDAHHGDGVQWAFYDDPNVCTLSIHETGRYLFPGTGNINERGLKHGYGFSYNVPIDAFTEDESFIATFESAFVSVIDYFKPDIIITQHGVDAHCYDPLTHLSATMKSFEALPKIIHQMAHQYCDGKWIALGGGGYDIWRVVPRAWAQLWSVMSTDKICTGQLPEDWVMKWQQESPVALPTTWHDPEGFYKPIPRRQEITEKNNQVLKRALQYITNSKNMNIP